MHSVLIPLLTVMFSSGPLPADENIPDSHIFAPLLGKRVVLEGIAWDGRKGISGRILLASGVEIYITDPYQTARDARGKPIKDLFPTPFPDARPMLLERIEPRLPQGQLVQVIGTLRFKKIPPATGLVQGYSQGFSYFALTMESFKVVERAGREFPEALPK